MLMKCTFGPESMQVADGTSSGIRQGYSLNSSFATYYRTSVWEDGGGFPFPPENAWTWLCQTGNMSCHDEDMPFTVLQKITPLFFLERYGD